MATITPIKPAKSASQRDSRAQITRQKLLLAAQQEIHRVGFQAASLDTILSHAGVTKGALYHHFDNKRALGYAVVDEWLQARITEWWVAPLRDSTDPLKTLSHMLIECRETIVAELAQDGCPLAALAHEMGLLDEGFRSRISSIYDDWMEAISAALARGQVAGSVRRDVSPDQTAAFIVAAMEGALMLGKTSRSSDYIGRCGMAMMNYLFSLRTPNT